MMGMMDQVQRLNLADLILSLYMSDEATQRSCG